MDVEKLKEAIQDSNLNFLVGSGCSVPFFPTLANTEVLLTELDKEATLTSEQKEIVRASILGIYFENVIIKNPDVVDDTMVDANRDLVLNNYKEFLVALNTIVLKRKSSILNKQVNVFTTNIDVFFEKALELTQLEFNDGFYGKFNPIFSLTNFKKSLFKRSLHYDNTSEIPVFNLLKVHGSLTWKTETHRIVYSALKGIEAITALWNPIKAKVINFNPTDKISHFVKEVSRFKYDPSYSEFLRAYLELAIINPTKDKFQDTILNLNYYELLRVLSNELEKENSILFVMGFSVADEHIREILLRAANSNPTLLILIFAYDSSAKKDIEQNIANGNTTIRYNNIHIIEPPSGKFHDFKFLNENVFREILNKID
jgi:hypothetical protein